MAWRRRRKPGKLWVHQLQLTITDFVLEIHDTHHPLGPSLYYEDQKGPAKKRTEEFWKERVPKYLGYFEQLLEGSGGTYVTGRRLTYVDLSLFQIVEGLRYAFPKRMKAFEREIPGLVDLHDRVAARPNIKAYLASERRIPFNEDGIFRRYKALDVDRHSGGRECANPAHSRCQSSMLRIARNDGAVTCSARQSASSQASTGRCRRCSSHSAPPLRCRRVWCHGRTRRRRSRCRADGGWRAC